MSLPTTYRITKLGVAQLKAEVGEIPKDLLQVLIAQAEVQRHFGGEEQFIGYLVNIDGFANLKADKRARVLEIFRDPFSMSTLNKMEIGEVFPVLEGLRARRIPGGWFFEYYMEVEKGEMVTASVFLNTNDIVDKS